MNQKTGCLRGCLGNFGAFFVAVFAAFRIVLVSFYRALRWWIQRIQQAKTPLETAIWLGGGIACLVLLGIWAQRTETGLAERRLRWTATAAAEAAAAAADSRATTQAAALSPSEPAASVAAKPTGAAPSTATSAARATTLASDPSPTPAVAGAESTAAAAALREATAAARATTPASDPSPTAPVAATAAAALPAVPTTDAASANLPASNGFRAAAGYPQPSDQLLAGRIVNVVDGDTVDIEIDGVRSRVRLIGVDTPESVDPREPVQCFGREASSYTRQLLDGANVFLEVDPTQGEFDRYNRRLGFVWRSDGRLVNYDLIRDGYAFEYTYNLPYRYQQEFDAAERAAREAAAGLWSPAACGGDVYRGVAAAAVPTSSSGSGASTGGSTGGRVTCPRRDDIAAERAPNAPLTLTVDKVGETVTLTNIGATTVDLGGWYVCSLSGGQQHEGISGSLAPGEARTFANSSGKAIWNNTSSDPAALFDPAAQLVAYWPN